MIKRILLSLLIIVGVGGSAVAGTQALLSDTATMSASTFDTGSVHLQIAKDSTSWLDSIEGFTDTLRPGQSKEYYIWLKNNTPDLSLALSARADTTSGTISPTKVTIAFTEVDGSGVVVGETVTNPLSTWDNVTPSTFGAGFDLPANTGQRYKMTVSLDDSATAGDFGFSFIFTGTQVVPES
jgi:hypothetical protein